MYQHLFAIVDRLPASWRPPGWARGLVHVRSVNGLDVPAGERVPAASAQTLAEHHGVVTAAMSFVGDVARPPPRAWSPPAPCSPGRL